MRFELRRLESLDDESLIIEVKRVAVLLGTACIGQDAFNRLSKVSSTTLKKRFGSWRSALARAGLADRYAAAPTAIQMRAEAARKHSDKAMLEELRMASLKLNGAPVTMDNFSRVGSINPETIRRRFGSWSKALDQAGLKIANRGKRYSEHEYFENLLRTWSHYGRQPSYSEMDKPPSCIRAGAYEARWKTWRNALRALSTE